MPLIKATRATVKVHEVQFELSLVDYEVILNTQGNWQPFTFCDLKAQWIVDGNQVHFNFTDATYPPTSIEVYALLHEIADYPIDIAKVLRSGITHLSWNVDYMADPGTEFTLMAGYEEGERVSIEWHHERPEKDTLESLSRRARADKRANALFGEVN